MATKGKLQRYSSILMAGLRLTDLAAIGFSGWISYWLRYGETPDERTLYGLIMAVLLTIVIFPNFKLYEMWRGREVAAELRSLLLAWLSVLAGLMLIALLTKTTGYYSRIWIITWVLSGFIALTVFRLGLRYSQRWLRAQGFNIRTLVIVGTGELAQYTANRVLQCHTAGFRLIGFLDDNAVPMPELIKLRPMVGDIDELADYVRDHEVDEVWIALPWGDREKIIRVLSNLANSTANIRIVPDLFSYQLFTSSLMTIMDVPVLNLSHSSIVGINSLLKEILDRVLAVFIMVILFPLMVAIALSVKLSSPGPVLFRQQRYGIDGRKIEIWKFRTMKIHAEEARYTQATRNDPRVTRLGAFLRRTSLDELPQFINVLQGRLSIVGPRPHPVPMDEQYRDVIGSYMLRYKVKPGITGLAQVNGYRGQTDTQDKIERRLKCDLEYIEHWSLWLDIKIILLTAVKGFYSKNAY